MNTSAVSAADIGRAIRSLRERRQISAGRVAGACGISIAMLGGIEAGRENPSIVVLDRVARAMNTKLVEIVREARKPAPPPAPSAVSQPPPSAPTLGVSEIARAIASLPRGVGSKVDAVIAAAVLHAMHACDDNQSAAARLLGMERKQFVRRLARAHRRHRR